MATHLRYTRHTFIVPDEVLPGNSTDAHPVRFHLAPAEGGDVARLRSVITATAGVVHGEWSPEVQRAVTAAFSHGAPGFIETIERIEGLTIPAAMALRAKVIEALPVVTKPGTGAAPDPDAPIAITSGAAFARICGFELILSTRVAQEILRITNETGIDTRFFASPSGSPAPATPAATPIAATAAPTAPEGPATADSPAPTAPQPDGTTPLVPSP
jgi:hypothetical protein